MAYILEVSLFTLGYCALQALLLFVVRRWIAWINDGEVPSKQALEIVAAIEFAAWIPFAVGWAPISAAYTFYLINAHELFDIVLVLGLRRDDYADWFRKFILSHHIGSLVFRSIILGIAWQVLPRAEFEVCGHVMLAFYCASLFLVTPDPIDFLLTRRSASRDTRFVLRISQFCLVRISHSLPILYAALMMHLPWYLLVLIVAGYLQTEYHSIKNGLAVLRFQYRGTRYERAKTVSKLGLSRVLTQFDSVDDNQP